VIAIDNSPAMLDVARDHLAQLGIDNVEVREGDLTQPPLNDDSIDAAVANMVLHHAEDPTGMLAEMTQVARPGGWVAITDAVEHPYEWMRTEQADIWLGLHARAGRGLLRLRATGPIRVRDPRIPVKHPVHDLGRGRHDRNLCCLGASPP
jgi:ubiquinone/menaquinone biosynthesis C-methylase UbiE